MKLYHSFESKNGFDLNNYDYDRGLFLTDSWWVGKPGYEKYSAFHPNEFGDKAVEIDFNEHVKTLHATNQLDFIEKKFPNNEVTKKIIEKFEMGQFTKSDWQKLDTFIGKYLKKRGYKMIHYTADELYGDVWVILDKAVIRGIRFEND